jgi:DMSO reductase family type II enzyme chaperone
VCPPGSEASASGASRDGGPVAREAVEQAIARAFVYRYLAQAFADPSPAGWQWLTDTGTIGTLRAAAAMVGESLRPAVELWVVAATRFGFEPFFDAYLALFGHAARGSCPLNEIEYGDIKADPLFQPHRLADLAAFYRAFGLEVAEDAGERQDHLCMELEFLCVLAAKEAYALEHRLAAEQLAQCREAQRCFLREHLGRWAPAFARRLAAATSEPVWCALAGLTRGFIELECARQGVKPGSEDLLLRPVDDALENQCASCGIANLPPGA